MSLGYCDPVAVAVASGGAPRRGDELHRADRAVPDGVAVEPAVVGVADRRDRTLAVERDADDRGTGHPVVAEHRAAVATVVGLHPADARQQGPRQLAARLGAVDGVRGVLVGPHRRRGEVVLGQGARRPGVAALGARHLDLAVPLLLRRELERARDGGARLDVVRAQHSGKRRVDQPTPRARPGWSAWWAAPERRPPTGRGATEREPNASGTAVARVTATTRAPRRDRTLTEPTPKLHRTCLPPT